MSTAKTDVPEQRGGAPAVGRALRVLEELAAAGQSLRMTDLADRLGLPKSSLHHVLAALAQAGWVERDPSSRAFALGLRAWEVGQAYETAQTLSQRAQPVMDAVRDQLGETVRLAVLSGTEIVCLAKSIGHHPLLFDQPIGARLPAHATALGKTVLAALDGKELRRRYAGFAFDKFTENTIGSLRALERELVQIREQGWAEDRGEYILGIRCLAVPVHSARREVMAAMSVSVPSLRFDGRHADKVRRALLSAASELSHRLGAEPTVAATR